MPSPPRRSRGRKSHIPNSLGRFDRKSTSSSPHLWARRFPWVRCEQYLRSFAIALSPLAKIERNSPANCCQTAGRLDQPQFREGNLVVLRCLPIEEAEQHALERRRLDRQLGGRGGAVGAAAP